MSVSLSSKIATQAPFFTKSSPYVGGRDPLGMQATSVATYSRLLPGITNVTNRVRYWSFYCWLVQLYSNEVHRTGQGQFLNFVRRGEFALAVAIELAAPDEGAVSGKDKARKAAQEDSINIGKYADTIIQGADRYWKYELGAFGQYYAGVLTDLGLLDKNEHGIFVCTDKAQHERYAQNLEVSGTELADAYREAIGLEVEQKFLAVISKEGIVGKEELRSLGVKMNLSAIQSQSNEWLLIKSILIGRDLPGRKLHNVDSFNRLNTIRLFLDYCKEEPERRITDFPFWLEGLDGLEEDYTQSDISFGWFYYAINEHWHYANEEIFSNFLEQLRLNDFTRLTTFVHRFIEGIMEPLGNESNQAAGLNASQWLADLKDRNLEDEASNPFVLALKGFYDIYELYEKYKDRLNDFIHFGQRLSIERHGDFGHGLRQVGEQLHRPPFEFLEWYLLRHIINRHLFVAMDKLATTGVNTQKFRLEEQVLYFINDINAGYTNPRLYQLALFLRDLKVLDVDFLPTTLADGFVNSLNKPEHEH